MAFPEALASISAAERMATPTASGAWFLTSLIQTRSPSDISGSASSIPGPITSAPLATKGTAPMSTVTYLREGLYFIIPLIVRKGFPSLTSARMSPPTNTRLKSELSAMSTGSSSENTGAPATSSSSLESALTSLDLILFRLRIIMSAISGRHEQAQIISFAKRSEAAQKSGLLRTPGFAKTQPPSNGILHEASLAGALPPPGLSGD